ncbi:MAG: hypothetical protein ACXVKC_17975, partial [Candidatus Angelobacter sp.]
MKWYDSAPQIATRKQAVPPADFAATGAKRYSYRAMLPFKLVYSDDYYLPIGSHVFPAEKYRMIHKRLL